MGFGAHQRICINWASEAKQGKSNTTAIYSNIIAPPVLSISLQYMGMVLDFPCLALEVQLIKKSVN